MDAIMQALAEIRECLSALEARIELVENPPMDSDPAQAITHLEAQVDELYTRVADLEH